MKAFFKRAQFAYCRRLRCLTAVTADKFPIFELANKLENRLQDLINRYAIVMTLPHMFCLQHRTIN
jgi:hypothetical protein